MSDAHPAATVLETPCPKCGQLMRLPLPPGLDAVDGQRLAGLVLCDLCADFYSKPHPQTRAVRSPMADP